MLDNKYAKWYFSIMAKAKIRDISGYTYLEKHHIKPKSIGGNNTKDNLVLLTAKEHFVAHRLLVKFVEKRHKPKMLRAVWSMARAHQRMHRPLTSRQFEIARKACAEAASLFRHTENSKMKIRQSHLGRKRSEQHRINIGLVSKGRKWSEEAKAKLDKTGSKNSRARDWLIISPEGTEIKLRGNFKKWCKEHNLPPGSPVLRLDGKTMTSGKWAGWSVLRL